MVSFTRKHAGDRIRPDDINEIQVAVEGMPDPGQVAEIESAIAPGNEGDLKATVGGTITNIRPGRIDARVRGLSTASSDNSTLLATLLTESASHGAEVWVPEGVYNASIVVNSAMNGARIAGAGTLRGVGGAAPITLGANATDAVNGFTVEGIGLDGAGVRSCVLTSGGGPYSGVTFRQVRFRNTAASGSSDASTAIRDTSGGARIVIADCVFEDTVGGGIQIVSPVSLQVIGNRFDGTLSGNFITVTMYDSEPYPNAGDGIVITGNVGRNGSRMGVELWAPQGAKIGRGAVVSANWFDCTGGSTGISVIGCESSTVTGNTVIGDTGYGLEIGSSELVVVGNITQNYPTGIIVNSAARSIIANNQIRDAQDGIVTTTSGSGADVSGVVIEGNAILNPRDKGIELGVASGGVNGLETIVGNVIWRSRVDDDDATRSFAGIQSSVPTLDGRLIADNTIIQGAASPTLSAFRGVLFTGTNSKRTVARNNTVLSLSTTPFGHGFYSINGTAAVKGLAIAENRFLNIETPLDGSVFDNTVQYDGNETDTNIQLWSRGQIGSLSIRPAKIGDLSSFGSANIHLRGHAASPPSYGDGYWRVGDIILNTTPSAGAPLGWRCVTAGNPGTWDAIRVPITASATLDFPSIDPGATAELTITVTGAAIGDTVQLGPPAALEAGLVATGYVSAANTVTVRIANVTAGAIDPASGTWRATVMKA